MLPKEKPNWFHKEELNHVDDVVENAYRHWDLDNSLAEEEYKIFDGIQLLLFN
jgi:hypothetical protein